jgi:phage shock protein A
MGIAARVVNIFKADVHGVMDQFEDQGLLLKQHLRDMEDALGANEAKLQRKIAARARAQQQFDKFIQQIQLMEQDLEVVIKKGRDDIARMLIRKIKPLENLCEEIARRISALDEEITIFKDRIAQQQLAYEQIKHRSFDFCQRNRSRMRQEDTFGSHTGGPSPEEIELELLKRKEALEISQGDVSSGRSAVLQTARGD